MIPLPPSFVYISSAAILVFQFCTTGISAAITCNNTYNPCEDLLWKGSTCRDGFCTNPFQEGCLKNMLSSQDYVEKYSQDNELSMLLRRLLSKPRVCNSEDGSDVIEMGFCKPAENDYPEVRTYTQNWEEAIMLSWMMQIIYSELLGVPSTVESGLEDKGLNFYDESNRLDYGTSSDVSVIEARTNVEGKDCTAYKKNRGGADSEQEYVPCADIVMSLWNGLGWSSLVESGAADRLTPKGVVGSQNWYITLPSVKKDSTLSSHYGLAGEENRRKLADTFKRPTTWEDYCTLVSSTNCTVNDGVATRPRNEDGSEDGKYFSEGSYTGYFRATEKNDCDSNPTNCTGHILDYPCGWASYVVQQAHHLGIALESDGPEPNGKYPLHDMVDIWLAANATKSDVIGLWWGPTPELSLFRGTGSDLIPVLLPMPTQECMDHRVDVAKRCDSNLSDYDMYGDSRGACADEHQTVFKMASKKLQELGESNMSPAYEVFQAFMMTSFQVDTVLFDWVSRGVDKFGFDLRFATCQYLADNLKDVVKTVMPPSHPRTRIVSQSTALTIAAIMFGIIAVIICVCTTGGITYKYRKGTLAKSAQIIFLVFLLVGLIIVSIGGLLLAFQPSNGTCTSAMWLIVVGYPTMLIPILIRVSAIIKIVRSSMKFKVVKVDKKKLIRVSTGLSALSAVYCIFWTIFDKPQSHTSLVVTDEQNDLGETIVSVSYYCDSESNIWFYVAFACHVFLLSCAGSLAYQMRQFPDSVNDSKPLAMMIYSSFFFLALRVMVFIVPNMIDGSSSMKEPLQKSQTIFISLDTVTIVLIFFSRFFMKEQDMPRDKSIPKMSSVDRIRSNIAKRNSVGSIATNTGSVDHFRNNIASRNSNQELEASALSEGKKERSGGTIRVTDGENKVIMLPKWVVEEYGDRTELEALTKTPDTPDNSLQSPASVE